MTDTRPDPDSLLDKIKRSDEQAARGRLKVFFGACAGVGKTYAMLAAGHVQQRLGVDVLVGVVETHGRSETASQLIGLKVLPPAKIEHRGQTLPEFDLDAALAIKPPLILIDELAHSNVAGSRHPKRWQDVEELLAAGIDVYTSLNVQHLERLNDVVGQITGIVVRETLPDHVFDAADEVTLVDLPPDELLLRLAEGKVYRPEQATRASQNFFRKGNLLALRELALRRTADRVDAQMRAYRADQSIHPVWKAHERLLISIGPYSGGDKLIRSACRLAASLHADCLVVYVETPELQRQGDATRNQVLKTLKLAQELGAETSVLAGVDLVDTLLAFARSRNVSKMVVGKSQRSTWSRLWRRPLSELLIDKASDVDVYVVAHDLSDALPSDAKPNSLLFDEATPKFQRHGYFAALGAAALTTLLTAGLLHFFDLANVVMLYLLAVVLVSVRYGRGAGAVTSLLSVAAFDFFFVAPRMSFTVSDTQYLLTFAVMLSVALIISHLTSRLRFEANVATYRERRTRALYELGRELSGALTATQIVEMSVRHLDGLFQSQTLLFIPDSEEKVRASHEHASADLGIAQWVYDYQQPAGLGTHTLPAAPLLYIPLKAPMRTRGVLAVLPGDSQLVFLPEQQRLLESAASQIALALERVHYVEVAQDAIVVMESERLRNGVLSAVSHDLRTPLTTLVGLASLLDKDETPAELRHVSQSLQKEAMRMNHMVSNLLDMAKLQSGVKPNKEWQLFEESVGGAVRVAGASLTAHSIQVDLPSDFPLLEYDAVLMERVLVNLLENAAKYTPAGSSITISAKKDGDMARIAVSDNGPGLPEGTRLFDKFTRGTTESGAPGVGLGLAICRSIIHAHGGQISARNLDPHGAEFEFTLPLGTPPVFESVDLIP
ncbi:sensor histidine kinase [Iodobacter fluviatilis]|uniref:histidine kinase n=1 Tax=Iodobacter fluviatilis TaxID=537 RepID=A0A377Q9E5_9NEIS|nr:sensor histidine kinase KdpD [Iodobacter fluviatilis]TCU81924.1 two-component system sensor histidine kinase KdpD [Iodobacter fluviatilis]STQ91543.1 Sensor protein KdpD [Iodobacter fluviatilis]